MKKMLKDNATPATVSAWSRALALPARPSGTDPKRIDKAISALAAWFDKLDSTDFRRRLTLTHVPGVVPSQNETIELIRAFRDGGDRAREAEAVVAAYERLSGAAAARQRRESMGPPDRGGGTAVGQAQQRSSTGGGGGAGSGVRRGIAAERGDNAKHGRRGMRER